MARIDNIEVFHNKMKVMTAATGTYESNKLTIKAPTWVSPNQALITIANKGAKEGFMVKGKQMDEWTSPPPENLKATGTLFKKDKMTATKLAKTGEAIFSG